MSKSFVHTIFCDDIRREEGGKHSLIGVYGHEMYVPAFPATLPKLGFYITLRLSPKEPLEDLVVRVMKDDEMLMEAAAAKENIEHAKQVYSDLSQDEKNEKMLLLAFAFVASPLKIDDSCTLKVRAYTGAAELKGGALSIQKTPTLKDKSEDR